jgi:AcrR family transcriptional regulator
MPSCSKPSTLGTLITELTTPVSERNAANAFVIALALGLMIGARHDRAARVDLDSALPDWLTAATNPVARQPLPDADASHMDDYPVLAPGDPALDILLNTALELISTRGFDQVTVSQIARAAGYTEGLAFRRYPTKLDMLRDATKRQNDAGLELNHAFTSQLQQTHGTAIAESVIIREAQQPSRALGRSMALEQIRLGWHHRELAQAQAASLDEFRASLLTTPGWDVYESETDFFLQFALSWGMYLLPFLNPNVHALPYDGVLVPLYDIFENRHGSHS